MKQYCAVFLCLILMVVSCSEALDVRVDNPRDFPVQVRIDQQQLPLEAGAFADISLDPGEHELITYQDSSVLVRGWFTAKTDGLLNATRSNYIRLRDVYYRSDVLNTAPEGVLTPTTIYIDQEPFHGDLQIMSDEQLFIPKSWDQQPDEALPAEDEISIRKRPGYRLISKLYRIDDFMAEYSEPLISVDTAAYQLLLDSLREAENN